VLLAGTQPPAVYRSTDRGYTWYELPGIQSVPCRASWTFPHPPHQAHIRKIAFNPSQPDAMLAAIEVGGMLRSSDGGASWTAIGKGIDADVHAVAFWPRDPRIVLAATGGGLFRSERGGDGWRRVQPEVVGEYVVSLVVQQREPWKVFTAARGGKSTISCSQDGGATWTSLGTGLPAPDFGVDALAIHPNDQATIYYGAQDPNDRQQGRIFASHDGGESWQVLPIDIELPKITRLAICC
jgi:photosystem II stability/assembly factor-like uncharacterized protein